MQARLPIPRNPTLVNSTTPKESLGAVYTRSWIVDLILNLSGYSPDRDLATCLAVEPAAGQGAFLIPMALNLVESARRRKRPLSDCLNALLAYEIDDDSAQAASRTLVHSLMQRDIDAKQAESLVSNWIRVGDYLDQAMNLPRADFVIGNPPYVRLEDLPRDRLEMYRADYSAMIGRADIYVAFFQAALSQLAPNGVCGFICADRWMLNQYGEELRRIITIDYSVEAVIEMHEADAFEAEVSAYPAITIIRRAQQRSAVVATIDRNADRDGVKLARALQKQRTTQSSLVWKGTTAERVSEWFSGREPWPCGSPKKLRLLKHLEARFLPLESHLTKTKVGIGVATGADDVYITTDKDLVESSRLLPLAMAADLTTGTLKWSGHYLVNPWDVNGLVDLELYPRLATYLLAHREALSKRHTAKKNQDNWMRTIDRVNTNLLKIPKLYLADIEERINPVFDSGITYPHHNIYFVQSETWDLEVLGGLLLSDFAQFFIELYGVKMRGRYLRFQAQYLRRIRVPQPHQLSKRTKEELRKTFINRDARAATKIASRIYDVESSALEALNGH